MTKVNNDWEKQFDKRFILSDGCIDLDSGIGIETVDTLKEFINNEIKEAYWSGVNVMEEEISKTLQQQRKKIIEECLKNAKDDTTGLYDYDRIAENVIDLIKK